MQKSSSPIWHLNHNQFGNKPWAVQIEALSRSQGRPKFAYWLEQGLGKTSLALNDFYDNWLKGNVDACLVIAPNSFKFDWAIAVEEWGLATEISYDYWPACEMPDRLENQLFAINYEAVSRPGKVKDYVLWLMGQSKIFLIIDESSSIANPQSQTTKAVIELSKRAVMVRELNGTPFTNNVMDYYGQLRAIGQLNGVNPYAFRNRFAKLGGFMGKKVIGIENQDQLASVLDNCSFRALKKDWRKDLPPKIYSLMNLEMTKRQHKHYTEMMEDFYTKIMDTEVGADMVLVQMGKLRQISSCLLMQEGKTEWLEEPKNIPKLNAAIDWVKTGPTKAMITCVYKASVELLYKTFNNLGFKPALIRGGMTAVEWAAEKRRFNEDKSCRILIGQQSAIFRGHTLIGGEGNDRCTRMFFYESDFSYYQRSQLEDRIHRGKQDQTCQYIDLLCCPIDRKTLNIITGKRDMAGWVDDLVALVRNRDW